jgi:hypothetical protein
MIDKKCLYCKKDFKAKKETGLYCSTSCRVMYSRKNKGFKKPVKFTEQSNNSILVDLVEKVDRLLGKEIAYAPITTNSFDGIKMSKITEDEHTMWQEPKKQPLKRTPAHWVELRRDCETADDYAKWLEDLENDTFLTTREKSQIKQTV